MSRSARASDWMSNLPLVLMGIRSSTRDDSAVSPAHLLYGGPLRLPGEFFLPDQALAGQDVKTFDFVEQLQRSLRDFSPSPADFHSGPSRSSVPHSLSSCRAVFVRVDAVKRPLTPPYVGPYEVLRRGEKTFVLLKSGKPWTVTVDRLKPFFLPVMSAPPCSSSHDSAGSSAPPAASSSTDFSSSSSSSPDFCRHHRRRPLLPPLQISHSLACHLRLLLQ